MDRCCDIGIAGQARMGKDTVADRLHKLLGGPWVRRSFAYNVKKVLSDVFGVSMDFIEEWKTKQEVPPNFDMEMRKCLQYIGDGFRRIRSTIWIDLVFREDVPKIISDVRYPNEFHAIHNAGGMNILVCRSQALNNDPNGSESLIRPYCEWALKFLDGDMVFITEEKLKEEFAYYPPGMECFDVFIRNDGTLEDLYDNIDILAGVIKNKCAANA